MWTTVVFWSILTITNGKIQMQERFTDIWACQDNMVKYQTGKNVRVVCKASVEKVYDENVPDFLKEPKGDSRKDDGRNGDDTAQGDTNETK